MINNVIHKITDQIDFNIKSQNVSYINIYNYKLLRKYPETISKIDLFTLDGIMLVIFIYLIKGKKILRKSPDFSSYFNELFCFLNSNKRRVFFLGGTSLEIKEFANRIKLKYPNIEITGYHEGFDFKENQVMNLIVSEQVDTVIVGMGTPKQELFISKLKEAGFHGSSYTCGAFFSQTISKESDYYPKLVNNLHLRWAYRIYHEPKLIMRYLIQYPIGLIYLLSDNFKMSTDSNNQKKI